MQDAAISEIKETFENWVMYEAVIRHDYMCHRELIEQLRGIAVGVAGELQIVDLGCGDAWLASQAFCKLPIASYRAVDLSESAAERARQHVAPWESRAEVYCGDLAAFVANPPDQSANFVLASNSLHHFGSDA